MSAQETQPRVYAALYSARTHELRSETEQRLASEASKAAYAASGWVTEVIREAYTRGVADGFAQGVAAASEPPQ